MKGDTLTVLRVQPRDDFVVTPSIEAVSRRAFTYLDAGYPVHFSGPPGTGKTTLALHLAALRGRSVMLIYGDEEFGTSDLVGGEKGVISKRVIDNFIHSVLKTEESVRTQWVDQRLTTACKYGYTLVYDEFSRSRPEANNVLLAILEEKLLALPASRYGETYMRVHPDFRAIFTSNPEEYAGVHKAQDALLDRMITIDLQYHDQETEIAITMAKSGISREEAERIVNMVRDVRRKGGTNSRHSIRACIMIATVVATQRGHVKTDDPIFRQTCLDVLGSNGLNGKGEGIFKAKGVEVS
ncbi:MAG: gas vesicle protein GvpN [Candidatus Tectomicrobia bacterium]|nr:gas vesicle protein GvpN [Candidatus Tectomicrobia bacterium]